MVIPAFTFSNQFLFLALGIGDALGTKNNNNKGKPLAWDVTVPDTCAESHIADTVSTPGAAAHQATQHKITKYSKLANTHMFPIAIKTAGTWDDMAIELVQEIGRRTTIINQDTRETVFLFERMSIALQRGNAVCFLNTMNTE